MKKMLFKLSQHLGWKVSAKSRVLVLTAFMAFFVVGLQNANAQKTANYLPSTQALEVLSVEIGEILAAKATAPQSATLENPVEAMKVMYYKGISLRLKEGMSTVDAVESNHAALVARAPLAEQTFNTLKTYAQDLVD